MTSIRLRRGIHIAITAAIFAVSYEYWLTTPVLQYISVGYWRLTAILVAAVCGVALSLIRMSVAALSCGAVIGLLVGGTLAALKAPHDVPVSLFGAFTSHLESFWREVLVLVGAATLAAVCRNYFLKSPASVR